ncbi:MULTISPECIES: hypothetical protein [Niastella]|uniref:PPM-type phosphatase domain-containing protein n=1 Tax=Niastella soli TaxID=2821487 RepID=A0ABS3YT18_9BACT|nr:hypothetical protein [Niastella soli]MBO9201030.1 hypothetical protein [Niastella soli]
MIRKIVFIIIVLCFPVACFCQQNKHHNTRSQKKPDTTTARENNASKQVEIKDSLQKIITKNKAVIANQQDTINKLHALKKPDPTPTPDFNWSLIAGCLLLFAISAFLYKKNRTMSGNVIRSQTTIDEYTGHLNKLKNMLIKRGLLTDSAVRHPGDIYKKIGDLIDQYTTEEHRNKEVNQAIEEVRKKLKEVQIEKDTVLAENRELQKRLVQNGQSQPIKEIFVPYVISNNAAFIKSEIILSAGPRKDSQNHDTELGEDIAGSFSLPGQTFFWLLDGTSDSAAIKGLEVTSNDNRHEEYHIFSSRMLAQSIGHFIQKNINRYFEQKTPLNELLTDATAYVHQEWEKRVNNEPAERKEAIIQLIRKGYKPLCSTTVIIGRLLENGHLYALRTGDSKIFPFKKANGQLALAKDFKFAADPTDEYDRVAFRLDMNENTGQLFIRQNNAKWLTQTAEEVQLVFAFTDGIGRVTEAQLASNNPGITEMIRQNISRIPQKTHDDKTLIILERVT